MLQIREIKGAANGFLLVIRLLMALTLLALSAPVSAASSSEQALRTRVEGLYGTLQRGDWGRAEKYLSKDSKLIFRNRAKTPVGKYEIQSIKLDPSGDSAAVGVLTPVYTGVVAGPVSAVQQTRWRLLRGRWYLELADPHAMPTPFSAPPRPQQASPPPPSLHPADLKFESTWASLGYVHKGEAKVARFAFTNVSQHVVTVAEVQTGGDLLKMKTQQKVFKPGEAGAFEFELNPSGLSFNVVQSLTLTVLLTTEPEHAYTHLTVAAILVPGSAPATGHSCAPR
jgi:hypothetical protein